MSKNKEKIPIKSRRTKKTRWSDFSHYQEVIADFREQWRILFSESSFIKGIALRFDFLQSIALLFFLFGIELALLSKIHQKIGLLGSSILSHIDWKGKPLVSHVTNEQIHFRDE